MVCPFVATPVAQQAGRRSSAGVLGCRARVAALEDANKRILEDQTAHVEALKLAREKLDALEQLEGTLQQQVCFSHRMVLLAWASPHQYRWQV